MKFTVQIFLAWKSGGVKFWANIKSGWTCEIYSWQEAGPGEIIHLLHFTSSQKLCSLSSRVSFYSIYINTWIVSSSSWWWLRSLEALVGLGLGLGQAFSHENPFFKYEYKCLLTQLTYLQILRGQCCFLLVVNMVTGSLGQPFSHENPSVNAALHGFHMQIHLSIIIIHLLPRWGHFCLNLTENCQSL